MQGVSYIGKSFTYLLRSNSINSSYASLVIITTTTKLSFMKRHYRFIKGNLLNQKKQKIMDLHFDTNFNNIQSTTGNA